jgi:methionyl-tRNA formyltransferase
VTRVEEHTRVVVRLIDAEVECHIWGDSFDGSAADELALQEKEQDHSQAKWYRRPQPSDLFIDWNAMNVYEVKALVRACNPWYKGAATRWKGWTFGIVYASVIEDSITDAEPGTILSIDEQFVIACKDGKKLKAEIAYCEEGFYPGHCMKIFGLQKNDRLSL